MRALLLKTRSDLLFQRNSTSGLSLEEISGDGLLALASLTAERRSLSILLAVEAELVLPWLQKLRQSGFLGPIIVLTADAPPLVRARYLHAGADDVLLTPIESEEVAARLTAILRRMHGIASEKIEMGSFAFYLDGRHPTLDGQSMPLSRREYEVMQYLAMNTNRVVSRNMIYDALYALSPNPPFEKIIEVYICRLRAKLAQSASVQSPVIERVAGRGYRLCLPTANALDDKLISAA